MDFSPCIIFTAVLDLKSQALPWIQGEILWLAPCESLIVLKIFCDIDIKFFLCWFVEMSYSCGFTLVKVCTRIFTFLPYSYVRKIILIQNTCKYTEIKGYMFEKNIQIYLKWNIKINIFYKHKCCLFCVIIISQNNNDLHFKNNIFWVHVFIQTH